MKLVCPLPTCRADNDIQARICARCATPLSGYARLLFYPAHLFNLGLSAARQGQFARARDLFAAIVYWSPRDRDARNALAMACFSLGDKAEASRQWGIVLEHFRADPIATQGLTALAPPPVEQQAAQTPKRQRNAGKSSRASRKKR